MKKRMSFGVPVAVAGLALIAAGCGSAGTTSATSRPGYAAPAAAATSSAAATQVSAGTVTTRQTSLGDVLVNAQGHTLYLFEKDKGMTSACSGACASIWPPLTATRAVAGSGLAAAKLTVARQPSGASDVTYAGHPLYTYVGDTKPGDVKGQGLNQFGAGWYVLSPSGKKIDDDGGNG